MPNLNAALLLGQLELLDIFKTQKEQIYKDYKNGLSGSDILLTSIPETTTQWNYWLMSVMLENKKERDKFLKITNKKRNNDSSYLAINVSFINVYDCQRDVQLNAEFFRRTNCKYPK